jgi:hypothetical protein
MRGKSLRGLDACNLCCVNNEQLWNPQGVHQSMSDPQRCQRGHLPYYALGNCFVGCARMRSRSLPLPLLELAPLPLVHFQASRQTPLYFVNVTTNHTQCLPRETTNCSASRTLSWTSRVLGKSQLKCPANGARDAGLRTLMGLF